MYYAPRLTQYRIVIVQFCYSAIWRDSLLVCTLYTYSVMNAVPTPSRVSRAQTPSPDVNFLYRIKGTSLVGECLAAASKTLKTELHVSGLREFL